MTDHPDSPSGADAPGNALKDPQDWVTGDEPMTASQRSYLKTLCEEAHEPMDETLTKAAAAQRIDELQHKTGRGTTTWDHAVGHAAERGDNTLKDPQRLECSVPTCRLSVQKPVSHWMIH